MKYEFHAEYPFALQDSVTQAFAIDWLAGKSDRLPHHWQGIAAIRDPMQRIALLSQAIVTAYKEQARMGTRRDAGGLRFWIENRSRDFLKERHEMMERIRLVHALPDLSTFPAGSWFLRSTFTLRRPYISRDDTDFYLLDNPVKKEWVFKVPYIAPSQWKGALRAAMTGQLAEWWRGLDDVARRQRENKKRFVGKRLQLTRLFGNEKGVLIAERSFEAYLDRIANDEHLNRWYRRALRCLYTSTGFLAGRLHFYPTFFDRIGLEVINPHLRDTGAGKQPIYFECVPKDAGGTFALLYVSLDGAGEQEALDDLKTVAEGVRAMMTRYGFGAKTSSGFGLAQESVSDGLLTVCAEGLKPTPEPAQATQPDQAVALPRYLEAPGQLHADLRAADGSLVAEEEYRRRIEGQGKKYAKKEHQLYRKAKAWWGREGKALSEADAEPESEQPAPPEASTPTWPSWPFDSFEELISQAGRVAEQLTQGGAA